MSPLVYIKQRFWPRFTFAKVAFAFFTILSTLIGTVLWIVAWPFFAPVIMLALAWSAYERGGRP